MGKIQENERNTLVIGIYFHPEVYPPTLNAVRELSPYFKEIIIVHRPHLKDNWDYPSNVRTVASGNQMSSGEQEKSSTLDKIRFFYQFVKDFYRECAKHRPSVILLYDTIPVLCYRLVRPLLNFQHLIWYHNHDIAEVNKIRKYSIGWFAAKAEKKIFSNLDLFTLPAVSRLPSFPIGSLKGKYIIVPNYPSRFFYDSFYAPRKIDSVVKLIFQGRINQDHGLENIIPLLAQPIGQKKLELVLKGYCEEEYKSALLSLADQHNVSSSVSFIGYGPYKEVPLVASQCHIGIGIFSAKEIMHLTLGTSSNKLYEYAAVGLPVIYSREKHFTDYLGNFDWAVDVEDNQESIRAGLAKIIDQYERLSISARQSFTATLNYERQFRPVTDWLTDKRSAKN